MNSNVFLRTRFLCQMMLGFLFLLPGIAAAQAADFTILSRSDASKVEIDYTLDALEALPQVSVRTSNEFVDGVQLFTGPLARVLLKQTNDINARNVKMIAANDYHVTIPIEDFRKYDVILATRQNGERFSPRDKGPIWVIYPMSDHAELRDSTYNSRLIWQLIRMEVLEN